MPDTLALETTGITCRFGGVIALEEADFAVARGEIVGLIGPNGSGKTTMLNVLSGIYRPTSGTVMMNGRDVTGMSTRRLARDLRLARTFQLIRLCPGLTVRENVLLGQHRAFRWYDSVLAARSRHEKTSRRYVDGILDFVGLLDRSEQVATSLPYGDQRRVEIARALATEPEVLLLDEPAAGMNPNEAQTLVELIRRIHAERRLSMVVIEHNMNVVLSTASRVVVFDAGHVIANGSPDEVRSDPVVLEAYLGRRFRNV